MSLPPPTSRIVFERISSKHLEDLVALDSDPDVMRHLTGGVPTPRESYEGEGGFLVRMAQTPDGSLGFFAAYVGAEFIGWFHLRPSVFDAQVPELGYRLAKRFWGRGLATEGARGLCAWAFDTLTVPFVDACTVTENKGSIAVMEKCGMQWMESGRHPSIDVVVQRYGVGRDAFTKWVNLHE